MYIFEYNDHVSLINISSDIILAGRDVDNDKERKLGPQQSFLCHQDLYDSEV